MLYYDRIYLSEGIDDDKSNNNKQCLVCHDLFFNHGLKFQDSLCNGCHDLIILCLNISHIAFITVKGVDYSCIIYDISTSEVYDI